MIKPCDNDPMKVRRTLAIWTAIYAFVILPHLLVFYQVYSGADIGLLQGILTYIGILASGPIGAYLYSAHIRSKGGQSHELSVEPRD